MNIKVFQNRKIEKDYFYNEGTQNENNSTVLTFEVPLGYEDFSKRIVFITEDGNFWDYVNNNQYEIKNNITKYGKVEAYLWLTKDNQDFRSQNFELNFYENENADNLVPTEEQLDGFATVLDVLELKINEVEELKNTIYQLQENVENALEDLDKKQQDYEQRFQAIDNKLGLKLDEVKANPFVKQVKYDNKSATFTFIAYDNTQVVVDLPIEETVIDGGYDPETQELYLVLVSGQEIRIPATDLVNDYEGLETATIQILISADNKITAHIKGGSITENLLSQEVAAKLNKVIDLTPYITKQESYEVFYTKSEVDEMVKEIQETNEYQSEIIDQFKNEFKQITVSGDSIHITDAAELPMELVPYGEPVQEVIEAEEGITVEGESVVVADGDVNKEVKAVINGNSYQETTEGYQLLNPANLSLFNKNKYIQTKTKIEVEANTEYSIVSNKILTDISINAYSDDTNNEKLTITATIKGNRRYYTFTTKANTKTLFFYTGQDIEYATVKEFIETLEMMLIKGTEEKPYEPYTGGQASPNTEYKQDVEVITECSLVQRGKNYFKNFRTVGTTITSNGITFTFKDKGIVNVKGTSTAMAEIFLVGSDWISTENKINLKENQKYTVSCNIKTTGVQIIPIKLASTAITYLNSTSNNNTFTADSNGISKILLRVNSDVTVNEDIELQIEDGEITTPYEPYKEPITKSIDLQGNSLAKVGDVKDLLKIGVDGRVSIEKKIYKDLFDGSDDEKWKFDTTKEITQVFSIENIQKVKAQTFLCNIFTTSTKDGDAEKLIRSDTIIFIAINKNKLEENSVQGFKKYLEQNNLVIYNQLAETEVIDLPSIEPITLFEGTNVFELVTNLGTTMTVTYNYVTPSPSIDRPSEIFTVKGSYDTELENEDASIKNTLPLTLTKELLGEIVTLTEEEAKQLNLDGAGKYRRTDYGRYVVTGDEEWYELTNPSRFGVDRLGALNNAKDEGKCLSNVGIQNSFAILENSIDIRNQKIRYNNVKTNYTLVEFKALLKEWYNNGKPLEFIYELQTPTYEKITDETELQQLSAYDKQVAFFGVNNINTFPTDDLVKAPLKIHATYSKSNKLTIQSLEDRLASLESQVTNLQDNQI